jgi:hypothetical protein
MVESKNKTFMPLLVVDFQFQNPSIISPIEDLWLMMMNLFFGVMTSNDDTLYGLLINGLFLFQHLHVKPKDCLLPPT